MEYESKLEELEVALVEKRKEVRREGEGGGGGGGMKGGEGGGGRRREGEGRGGGREEGGERGLLFCVFPSLLAGGAGCARRERGSVSPPFS